MPSTITTYYTFAPATKARSSQVNTNFSNYRGDLLPINENTTSASDNTHYLGGPDHYWAGGYLTQVDLRTSTTTATLILKGDTTNTTGAFDFQIEGVSKAYIGASGLTNISIEPTARTIIGVTFTSNSTWTVPAGLTQIKCLVVGGGGGGGHGANQKGGAGGGGASAICVSLQVTSGEVLSIAVGSGGAGAIANTTTGTPGLYGSNGTNSVIYRGGSAIAYGIGANGGFSTASVGGIQKWDDGYTIPYTYGVFQKQHWGGVQIDLTTTASGQSGQSSEYASGGTGGANSGANCGGGGGGASYGIGGNGGAATTGASTLRNGTNGGYGAGGGGGGHSTGAGGAGGNGIVIIYHTKTT